MSQAPAQAPHKNRFTSALHAALGVSLLGLWMSGTTSPVAMLLLAGVLGWAMVRAHRGVVPSERAEFLWNIAAVAYLGVYALDLFVLTGNLLGASLRLLVFLSVQRLMGARTDRDRVHLLLISFLSMVAATAATTEFTFALPLALYLVAVLRALACRQLDATGVPAARVPGPGVRTLAGWTSAILVLGTAVFFLIPHIGTGYFRAAGSLSQRLSGFSGRIELGSINSIKKNHEIAMRVRLEDPPPQGVPLRWRGLAFDRYDGRAWNRSSQRIRRYPSARGGFQLAEPSGGPSIAYEVSLEPMGTSALFAAASPLSIETNDFLVLTQDAEAGLHRDPRRRARVRYRVLSELRAVELLGSRLAGAGRDYPRPVAESYLAVPPMDPGIPRLAREMAGGATDPFDVVMRIYQRLRQDYTYTLDVNDRGVADPLARFLLEGAPGHCEYFATSMAMLTRSQGIPSRVVAGFLQGEYSELHRTYLVRQSDAHSWVEVYFPGHGWVGFDPTPTAPLATSVTLLARLRRMVEQVEIAWDTWIVGLDLNDQASILGTFRSAAAAGLSRITQALSRTLRSAQSMRRFAWGAAWVVAITVLLAALRRFLPALTGRLRRWRPRGVRPAESDRLVDMYRRFLKALERHGIHRPASLTPLEFARQAEATSGQGATIREVTDIFCRARYSGLGLSAAEVHRVESLIARLPR